MTEHAIPDVAQFSLLLEECRAPSGKTKFWVNLWFW